MFSKFNLAFRSLLSVLISVHLWFHSPYGQRQTDLPFSRVEPRRSCREFGPRRRDAVGNRHPSSPPIVHLRNGPRRFSCAPLVSELCRRSGNFPCPSPVARRIAGD